MWVDSTEMENIFDPFYGSSPDGRGLGLAVVYGLVSSHNGVIQLESKVGFGTAMRVLFPVLEQPKSSDSDESLLLSQPWENESLSVLVVDDEPSILEWIESLGDIENIEIQTAKSGREVVEMFCSIDPPEITCIVLDMVMPDMDGTEVLDWMVEKGIDLPVVAMSGHSPGRLGKLHRYENVMGAIEKPFSGSDLLNIVRRSMVWRQLAD